MLRRVSAIKKRNFKSYITKLIKRHGKVLVIFSEHDGHRRRLIEKDGSCKVAYKTDGHKRWSGYGESCFMSYTQDQRSYDYYDDWDYRGGYSYTSKRGKKKTLRNTLNALVEHDEDDGILALEIHYGKGFKKKTFVLN